MEYTTGILNYELDREDQNYEPLKEPKTLDVVGRPLQVSVSKVNICNLR